MNRYGIVGTARVAAFIAQVGHESGQLRYVREIWGPTAQQLTYEGRADLGNTVKGDGSKYHGRGLIQITGRANYAACGEALGLDLINKPELLELPQHAAMSAAWFWSTKGLNTLADQQHQARQLLHRRHASTFFARSHNCRRSSRPLSPPLMRRVIFVNSP